MKNIFFCLSVLFAVSVTAQDRYLKVEKNHSTIGFEISIAGFTKVTGKFIDFEILMDWDDADVTASKITSVIQASSINTGIPDRDKHLASEDFFDVDKYPTITFESDSIQKIDFSHFNVFGKFSMHGVSKNMTIPFQIVKADGNTIGFKAKTTINRLDYGVGSEFKHTSMPDFLANEIEVEIYYWTKKRNQ